MNPNQPKDNTASSTSFRPEIDRRTFLKAGCAVVLNAMCPPIPIMAQSNPDNALGSAGPLHPGSPKNRSDKPNIIFIFSDQQHWKAVGFEDDFFTTPHSDAFAKDSVIFNHCYCTTPQCSPSRSSILTGAYPTKTGVLGNCDKAGDAQLDMSTIGESLQKAGYHTGYFGKWHLGQKHAAHHGWDEQQGIVGGQLLDDPVIAQKGVEFLRNRQQSTQPFALFLAFKNPHDIYKFGHHEDPSPDLATPLPPSWEKQDFSTLPAVQKQFMTDDQGMVIVDQPRARWEQYRRLYREKVRLYDHCAGTVLNELKTLGLYNESLVIMTSDHGDMDTSHRLIFKGPFVYDEMVRVPLMIKPPASVSVHPGGTRSDRMVVNVDLAPTLAAYAGADHPRRDGLSLKPFLTGSGKAEDRTFVVSQYYAKQQWINPIRMIRTREWKYTRYLPEGEELYDLINDPHECRNLAKDTRVASVKAELSARLDQWIRENNDPFYTQQATPRNRAKNPANRD